MQSSDCWIVPLNALIIRWWENNPESLAGPGLEGGSPPVYKRDSTASWEAWSLAGLRPQQLDLQDLEDSPWILVPASLLVHPPSSPVLSSDWSWAVSAMRSLDLLFVIATLCVGLMLLPRVVHAIPLDDFYPYGTDVGDAVLPRNDDGVSSAISLGGSGFRYFGNSHTEIFVSNFNHTNRCIFGIIVAVSVYSDGCCCPCPFVFIFSCRSTTMDPSPLMMIWLVLHLRHSQCLEAHEKSGSPPFLVGYWADIDTRPSDGGFVYYRMTTNQALLDRASNHIMDLFSSYDQRRRFEARWLLIATWERVGYYRRNTDSVLRQNVVFCLVQASCEHHKEI